ncbi:unnamed protein product [Cuscuta campestris]|uniref:Uncharacterized protein n=1 Tax=Cuscuta campestris TaxID=132261 RepID=A0A484LF49_9ASTE|nr:unnamed protein product [Cuscuta campestris]
MRIKRGEVSNLMPLEAVVNIYDGVDTFASLEGLIKNWEDLSKAWALYAATRGQHFDVAGHNILLEKGKIGCCQSLGESLGLLCRVDLARQAAKLGGVLQKTVEEEIKA